MYSVLGKSFIEGEYKTIRQDVLFSVEYNKIPDTLQYVSNFQHNLKIKNNVKKQTHVLKNLETRLQTLQDHYIKLNQSLVNESGVSKGQQSLDCFKEISKLQADIPNTRRKKQLQLRLLRPLDSVENGDEGGNGTGFFFHCYMSNCKGLIPENGNGKCIICKKFNCTKCQCERGIDHICDTKQVESVELLKKECKSCPKCRVLIYKISGCDQMYCTKCKTAFSWNTGFIEKGMVHNPHYFEEQRQNLPTPEPEQQPLACQDLLVNSLPVVDIINRITNLNIPKDQIDDTVETLRKMIEIKSRLIDVNQDDNLQYRLEYMCNILSKQDFIKKIYINDKKGIQHTRINNIYNLFLIVSDDLIKRLVNKDLVYQEYLKEYNVLKVMTNTELHQLRDIFKIKYSIFI